MVTSTPAISSASWSRKRQDRDARRDFAASLGNVANLRSLLHDSAGARLAYREVLQIFEQLAVEEPSVPKYRDDLALTYNNMAFREEDSQAAVRDLRKAMELREQLLPLDPTNPLRRRNLARTCQNLGIHEYDAGPSEAFALLERCCRLLEEVVRAEPANTTYQCDLGSGYINQSDLLVRGGRLDEAVRSSRRAREVFERLLTTQPRLDVARTGLMGGLDQSLRSAGPERSVRSSR